VRTCPVPIDCECLHFYIASSYVTDSSITPFFIQIFFLRCLPNRGLLCLVSPPFIICVELIRWVIPLRLRLAV